MKYFYHYFDIFSLPKTSVTALDADFIMRTVFTCSLMCVAAMLGATSAVANATEAAVLRSTPVNGGGYVGAIREARRLASAAEKAALENKPDEARALAKQAVSAFERAGKIHEGKRQTARAKGSSDSVFAGDDDPVGAAVLCEQARLLETYLNDPVTAEDLCLTALGKAPQSAEVQSYVDKFNQRKEARKATNKGKR